MLTSGREVWAPPPRAPTLDGMTNSLPHRPSATVLPAEPGALLTAIPGLFGFVPERSLVFILIAGDGRVAASARNDLLLDADGTLSRDGVAELQRLGEVAERYAVEGVVAAIIDDRLAPGDARYRDVFNRADAGFAGAGGLCAGLVAPRVIEGGRWLLAWTPPLRHPVFDISGREPGGTLGDPRTSPIALERAVYSGRAVLATRGEIAAGLTRLPHCAERPCRAVTPGPRQRACGSADARDARWVIGLLRRHDPGVPLRCKEANRLARALCSVHVRDMLLAIAVTEERDAAEYLWTEGVRRLRGTAQAAAGTLLAHLYYVAGEGAYAGAALAAALVAEPEYRMARMLDAALGRGIEPRRILELAEVALALTAEWSVPLGGLLPELWRD